jgi:hypothetical protein
MEATMSGLQTMDYALLDWAGPAVCMAGALMLLARRRDFGTWSLNAGIWVVVAVQFVRAAVPLDASSLRLAMVAALCGGCLAGWQLYVLLKEHHRRLEAELPAPRDDGFSERLMAALSYTFTLFAAWMLVTSILGNLFNDLRDPAVARLWSVLSYALLALLPVLIAHGLISGYRTLALSTRQLFALGAWLAWGLFGAGLLAGRPFLGA